jgi:cell division septum initiation protein DivIVA
MAIQCPHLNPNCSPARRCGPCSGGIVQDGEQVITRMMFLDSVQNAIATRFTDTGDAIRAQARADHEEWKRGQQTPANDGAKVGFDDSARHTAAKAQANARLLADAAANAARVLGYADGYREQHERDQAAIGNNPRDKAYAEMCDSLQRRC